MTVCIKRLSPMRVAFVRHVGPYGELGEAWSRLMAWAGPRGLLGQGARMLGVVHDDPEITPADKIRYDACLVVGEDVQAEGDIGIQEIAGGDYAVTTHKGPHERLGETYARLCGGWFPSSGREPASRPAFEVYRNSPQDTAPGNLLTDIHMPLAD